MPAPEQSARQDPRPGQVTVAGWGIAIASVLLLISVFDTMGNLHTVDMREQVAEALRSGEARGLGISVDTALEVMRWCLYVTGAAAGAAAILGGYALQRNTGARIGLTVAVVPIVLTAPLSGSFLGMFIAAGVAILWTQPARDWFAGRPITPRPSRPLRPGSDRTAQRERQDAPVAPQGPSVGPPVPPAWAPPAGSDRPQPPPMPGWGAAPPPSPYDGYPPHVDRRVTQPVWQPVREAPNQVRVACILTWVAAGITGAGALLILLAVAVDRQQMLDAVRDSPAWKSSYDEDTIMAVALVVSIVVVLWCIAVSVLAVFTWRGVPGAWVAHIVSAAVAALVAVLGFPVSLLHLVAIGVTLGMLLGRSSQGYFREQVSRRRQVG